MANATIKGRLIEESELALHITQKDGMREAWIPRSTCHRVSKGKIDFNGERDVTVVCDEWIAQKKGLDYEAD